MKFAHWRILLFLIAVSIEGVAQSDSSFIFTAYQNAIALYPPIAEYQSLLYNGSEY